MDDDTPRCTSTRTVTVEGEPDIFYDCVLEADHHEDRIVAGEYVEGDVHETTDGIRWR